MRILFFAKSNICLLLVLIAYNTAPLQADDEMSLTNFAASFDPVFATLLTLPEVQDELKISKSQSEELLAVLTKYRDEWLKHAETFTKQVETSAKFEVGKEPISLKNLHLTNQEYSGKILAILQPKQQGRFLEIYLRTRAKTDTASVLLLAIVRDKLQLADEQVEQLEKIQKKAFASNVKTFQDGRETVKGIKGTSIETIRELKKAVSRMQEKQQTSIKNSSVEALKVLNEEQNTTFEKMQGPAVPIKIAENSLDKDAELFKLNKTIDSVEQMIQIWKSSPLTELEQVYSVLLQGAKLTDEKRNAQVKQFENQLKQNQEKRLQLMRIDNSIAPKIAGPVETMPATGNLLVAPFSEAKAKEVQKEVAKNLKKEVKEKVDLGEGVKLDLVLIPAGKFVMGSHASEKRRRDDGTRRRDKETQHEVTLTKPYYMGKYEVTQEQWEAVMGNNPSDTKGAKLPVTNFSWNDCQEFIKKLNAKTDGGYRLPTEAEWEYACRAGTTTAYSFGDEITPQDANYEGPRFVEPVAGGSFKANAFGLYDMHGNVWEWCEDWYAGYPLGVVTDPRGPVTGENRVMRGGSFTFFDANASSSYRGSVSPSSISSSGFRLVRTADSKGSVASPTETKPDPEEKMPGTGNLLVAPFSEAKAKEVQKEVAKNLKKEVEEVADLGEGVKLDLVLIPAGKFKMGSPASEKLRQDNETQHEVTLTKPYYLGKYEVTQEQWEAVMGNIPTRDTKGAKLPVRFVSWNDCQEFIKKLNVKTDGGYRLPTEAEWEYACRAGTTTAYSFGDKITPQDANYGDSEKDGPVAVGSYKPNAFGLYDMHGNVCEWCEDWHGDYPAGAVTDPRWPDQTRESRVLRGGTFSGDGSVARSSNRGSGSLNHGAFVFGFRLARTVDSKGSVASPTETRPDPVEKMPATGNLLVAPFSEAKAKEVQKEVAKNLKKEVEEVADLGEGVKLDLVLIPAGRFKMGLSAMGSSATEKQHEVTLTKPYYLGKYEVTQEQWEAVMGNNPSDVKGVKLPVTNVSWNDCQEFIQKLNAKTDGGYRLPTGAEGEYACRAGTTTAYSFGDKITPQDANYKDSRIGEPVAVGSYKANAFGLFDMHGNVQEWCEDCHDHYPFAVTDPKRPVTREWRGVRGGSSSNALSSRASTRTNRRGFRLARTADSNGSVASPTETRPDPVETMPATGNLLVAPFSEAKAKEVQKEVAKNLKKEVEEVADLGEGVKLDLVLIPAGKFVMGLSAMGSSATEKQRGDKERQHEVTLTSPYYLGKYEVTQEQWEAVMGNNPSFLKGAKLPVTNMSWENCKRFINKLNVKTDGGYRLPTEAEWEYACRAGTTTLYSFGDKIGSKDANYYYPMRPNPRIRPNPIGASPDPVAVGSYEPNAFGLYDMHGNISEWCEDRFEDYPAGSVTDPMGPATGYYRVMRGGSSGHLESGVRSSDRSSGSPSDRFANFGFRLARTK